MIGLSLSKELSKISLSIDKPNCLKQLGILYSECIKRESDFAQVVLSLFYQAEAQLYDNENPIKELKAIISDLNPSYSKVYRAEILLILITHLETEGLVNESQKILKDLSTFNAKDLTDEQSSYIERNLVDRKPKVLLKGKELVLYTALEDEPSEKFDLIFKIYGDDCDISKAERSFKTLLNRLRKKLDQEIVLNTDNLYELR